METDALSAAPVVLAVRPWHFVSRAYYEAWLAGRPLLRPEERRTSISRGRREWVLRQGHWQCADCQTRDNLTVDHVIPWVFGGSDHLENLRARCGACNTAGFRRDFGQLYDESVKRLALTEHGRDR